MQAIWEIELNVSQKGKVWTADTFQTETIRSTKSPHKMNGWTGVVFKRDADLHFKLGLILRGIWELWERNQNFIPPTDDVQTNSNDGCENWTNG
jgi:hypothetical protein